MFKKSKKEKKDKEIEQKSAPLDPSKCWNVLVIDSDGRNWHDIFQGTTGHDGRPIRIEKTEWSGMVVTADDNSKPIVNIKPNKKPIPDTTDSTFRTIQPDIVLVRQLVRGLVTPDEDYTNALYGLLFNNTPAVNTLESIARSLERPYVYSQLNMLKKKLGADKFPLIPMSYYSHQSGMMFTPEYPLVVKVGSAEAGYGKLKAENQQQLQDVRSLLALHKDYITLERYVPNREYDIRVQKIGNHIRVYKRVSANWKGNVGTSSIEEIPVSEAHKLWATEVGILFGMDILTVDAIHTTDGKDVILEINDTASGLYKDNEKEDMGYIRDLVLQKLEAAYPIKTKNENN